MPWVREESFETGFACHGAVVMARVTRDGALELDGYDLQYEQAYMEFYGGEPSACFDMYQHWEALPARMIMKYFNIMYYDIPRLALDWAEHVSWIIPVTMSLKTDISRRGRVFDEARELIQAREDTYNSWGDKTEHIPVKIANRMVALQNNVKYFSQYYARIRMAHGGSGTSACFAVQCGLRSALDASRYRRDSENGRFLSIEQAISAANDATDAITRRGKKSDQHEKAWQVRRFIDVMSAKKHKQPWPPLKWTK